MRESVSGCSSLVATGAKPQQLCVFSWGFRVFFVPIAAVVFSLRASFIQSFVGFFFVGAGLVGIGFFEVFFSLIICEMHLSF